MNAQNTTINISISLLLESRLKEIALKSQKSEQELIIEAVESYIKQFSAPKTCYDLAIELNIIGSVPDLPSDLSTNSNYFDRFGS